MKPVIQTRAGGVLLGGQAMNALAASYADIAVNSGETLEREFQERLAECSTLAFRVAMGVLRDRAEAEDVAQEAMLRAYRNFQRLRNPERFRSWLVRIAWRMALDHQRADRRRLNREQDAAATMRATRITRRSRQKLSPRRGNSSEGWPKRWMSCRRN